jgi:hypothetical protein
MKKDIYLAWLAGCIFLAGVNSVHAENITYTCPAYTALTEAEVPNDPDLRTYTGNLVGGSAPALAIGTWTKENLPKVSGFTQARFDPKGLHNTPVLNCWYSGTELGHHSNFAVNGQASLPSGKSCKMEGPVDARGNCRDTDPTKCRLVCSD